MVRESAGLASLCRLPFTIFHPAEACQPANPCDQSAWKSNWPGGTGVTVGAVVLAGGAVVVPQAISSKARHPGRRTCKLHFRKTNTLNSVCFTLPLLSRQLFHAFFNRYTS